MNWIGLDIGGANIKACLGESDVFSVEFPLWKHPQRLDAQLQSILRKAPGDVSIAVTMTGELADCFSNRSEGVDFIVSSIVKQAGGRKTVFYATDGQWVDAKTALNKWIAVAASNWHAIASYCSRFLSHGNGFLIDIGSTTTDIIPIRDGQPATAGKTDYSRLAAGELCYAGIHRTPVCGVLTDVQLDGSCLDIAREFFASMQDVFIVLGEVNEAEEDCQTTDGRPASFEFAAQRLSRMVCTDAELLSRESQLAIARQSAHALQEAISKSLTRVVAASTDLPLEFVVCGQGEWFAKKVVRSVLGDSEVNIMQLSEQKSLEVSHSAAAYSVARLASETTPKLETVPPVYVQTITREPVRVVKVGGSLLKWEKACGQIEKWLAKQPKMTNVWIAGGGELADFVRQWHLQNPLGQENAHWICIDVMSITTRLLKSWFPSWQISDEYETLLAADSSANILFDPSSWLRMKPGLLASWQATSDSCAGFLAQEMVADELVLLKSCETTGSNDLATLSREGIVDNLFSQYASGVPQVRMVNLRDQMLTETVFASGQQLSKGQIASR